jgi:hypothetical protein
MPSRTNSQDRERLLAQANEQIVVTRVRGESDAAYEDRARRSREGWVAVMLAGPRPTVAPSSNGTPATTQTPAPVVRPAAEPMTQPEATPTPSGGFPSPRWNDNGAPPEVQWLNEQYAVWWRAGGR